MNKTDNQKLKYLLNMVNFFNDNSTVTNTVLNAAVWLPQLDAIVNNIITEGSLQYSPSTGNTQDKQALRTLLENQAFFIAISAKAYARKSGNKILYPKVDLSLPVLQNLNDPKLMSISTSLVTDVSPEVANIALVSTMTAQHIIDFKKTIADFTLYIPQAQKSRAATKKHTDAIARLLLEAKKLLEEIHDYVELLRFTDLAYFQSYQSANKIGKANTRNRALQISVKDKDTKVPIFKADIFITDSKGAKVMNRKTAVKGNCYIQDLKEETYTLNIVQEGYQNYTTTVSVTDGTTAVLAVALEKTV
jgi:hypothetical protein